MAMRAAAVALVACALVLRLVIPQGWMPVRTVQGWHLTICTGSGPIEIAVPGASAPLAHHGPVDPDPAAPHDHSCVFSGLAQALHPPSFPAFDPPPHPVAPLVAGPSADVGIGRGLAAPPPPATGPPAIL